LEHDNLVALSPGEQLAWLRRVAHNKLLNNYRKASRSPQVALDTLEGNVISSEIIQAEINGPFIVTGNFTQQQAFAIFVVLKYGLLPVELKQLS